MEIDNVSTQEALAMYRVYIRKYQATRWSYGTHNPQGGSFGTGAFTSARSALQQALRGVPGGQKVLVTQSVWDAAIGDYRTTKQFTLTKE